MKYPNELKILLKGIRFGRLVSNSKLKGIKKFIPIGTNKVKVKVGNYWLSNH